jgi:hypothetical protein
MDKRTVKKVTIQYDDDSTSEIEFSANEHYRLNMVNFFNEENFHQSTGSVKKATGERALRLIVAPENIIDDYDFID